MLYFKFHKDDSHNNEFLKCTCNILICMCETVTVILARLLLLFIIKILMSLLSMKIQIK